MQCMALGTCRTAWELWGEETPWWWRSCGGGVGTQGRLHGVGVGREAQRRLHRNRGARARAAPATAAQPGLGLKVPCALGSGQAAAERKAIQETGSAGAGTRGDRRQRGRHQEADLLPPHYCFPQNSGGRENNLKTILQ